MRFVIWYFRELKEKYVSRFEESQKNQSEEIGLVLQKTMEWLLKDKYFEKEEKTIYIEKKELDIGPGVNEKE